MFNTFRSFSTLRPEGAVGCNLNCRIETPWIYPCICHTAYFSCCVHVLRVLHH